MDWIRRNWPDVLIGVALVAVIAGIIVTLLGGGSVFDFSRSPRTPSPEPGAAVTAPQVADEPVSPLATPLADDELADDTLADDELAGDEAERTADGVIPVTPSNGAQTAEDDAAGELAQPLEGETATAEDAETTVLAGTPTTETPVTTEAPATTTPATTPTTQATAPSPDAAPGTANGEPWRIVVGTFRVPDNAERLAAEMRDEGHPVFIATQGELNVVMVGPFADEGETRALAQEFRDDGREADVFRLNAAARATSSAAASVDADAPVEITPVETTPVDTAALDTAAVETTPSVLGQAATGSRYVQVGAYRSDASAAPQRERLEALGYEVTVLTTDTGLIRLLIGPFTPEEAASVRERLDAQGIEHTPGPATLN